jgi:hypothetical protein
LYSPLDDFMSIVRKKLVAVVGEGVPCLPLGDAVSEEIGRARLYARLIKEGLGLIGDVYGGEEGSGTLPIAEAWDKRINNMASAHGSYSRDHSVRAMLPFDLLAQWFAGTDPMKRMCLDHYILGKGTDLKLTLEQMKLMPTYFDLFHTKDYSPHMLPAIEEARQGRPVRVDTLVSGQNDALGNFAIHVVGNLKPANGSPTGPTVSPYAPIKFAPVDPGAPLMFEGAMDWIDKWDFDPKMAKAKRSKKSTGRSIKAELAVDAVAALVDGAPFKVSSVSVPMCQYSGRFPVY